MPALLVAATSSDAGKSFLVAGLLRALARGGLDVAPFKAQNMSLNSVVVPGGGAEIARVQATQARAAGKEPCVDHNPVLLKPTGAACSQVVVKGKARWSLTAAEYHDKRRELLGEVLGSFDALESRHGMVVCEGAGALAEINLREGDLANFALLDHRAIPAVVVADIDRGGAFSSLAGTWALLEEDRHRIAGFILNKFRGDRALLKTGIDTLEAKTGVPVLGVVPYLEDTIWEVEDSLSLVSASIASWRDPWNAGLGFRKNRARGPVEGHSSGVATEEPRRLGDGEFLRVAVVRLPRMSNFSDLLPLALDPRISLVLTTRPADVYLADLLVLPGSKATVDDLEWLYRTGLGEAIVTRVREGRPVVGICGGYQMLAERIVDGIESACQEARGLGLLPLEFRFAAQKLLSRTVARCPVFACDVEGFEIRYGRAFLLDRGQTGAPLFVDVVRATGGSGGDGVEFEDGDSHIEGLISSCVLGTSLHGLFENDLFRSGVLSWAAEAVGKSFVPSEFRFGEVIERSLDLMGEAVEANLDLDLIVEIADTSTSVEARGR
jgi:adenosylcobyric acid synthase